MGRIVEVDNLGTDSDHTFMRRCLQLARNGRGTTYPNPSVGSLLTVDDHIIGEGFTSSYGGNHAEVNAIRSVADPSRLKRATLYVTLEPCSHFGKTPPCADLIIEKKNTACGHRNPGPQSTGGRRRGDKAPKSGMRSVGGGSGRSLYGAS